MPIVHEQLERMLPDFAAGTLSSDDRMLVHEHLQSCASCREALISMENVLSALRNAPSPKVPHAYFQTILPRFRSRLDDSGSRWRDWVAGSARFLAPVAAVVLVGLMLTAPFGFSGSDRSGLRILASEYDSGELAEALLEQTTLSFTQPQDVLTVAVSDNIISRAFLEHIAGESGLEELASLQKVEDLDNEELETILRRLEQRTML